MSRVFGSNGDCYMVHIFAMVNNFLPHDLLSRLPSVRCIRTYYFCPTEWFWKHHYELTLDFKERKSFIELCAIRDVQVLQCFLDKTCISWVGQWIVQIKKKLFSYIYDNFHLILCFNVSINNLYAVSYLYFIGTYTFVTLPFFLLL